MKFIADKKLQCVVRINLTLETIISPDKVLFFMFVC